MVVASIKTHSAFQNQILELVKSGHTQHGLPDSAGNLFDQANVINQLAQTDLATAFSVWSHRMATEYLVRFSNSSVTQQWAQQLRNGELLGSTALATALVDASGRAELPVQFDKSGEKIILNGFIPWASNLSPETVVVFAARNSNGDRYVFSTKLNVDGISVKLSSELLALNETESGSIQFENAEITSDQILSRSLKDFLALMRPRFLTLQTGFCLGVSEASLAFAKQQPGKSLFETQLVEASNELLELRERLQNLASRLTNIGEITSAKPYLQLRLDAAVLAQKITRLEFAVFGGRGFSQKSDTARRVHEALFFIVQAPTEGALRWELAQSK